MRSTGMAGWLLVAVAIALSTTAYAGTVTASVTLSGPDECWVEEDVTYTATGTFEVDPEIQEELDDGEATLKEEYSWSYAPAQLVSGGGPQDDWVTIRYNDADGGQHHTVSVSYTVTVTYADDTSDSASAGDSIQVWVKQVAVGAERNKDTICAGGVDSSPHQATITATVTGKGGQPLSGKTVTFSLTNSDGSYPASIDPQQATTDASGKATTTLTSSQKIGVTATVKATCQNVEAETDPITMAKAQGTWEIDPQVLIADGESTADVSLTLEHAGEAVDGHSISWRIFKVWDGSGNEVYTADPEWGSKAGYGSIAAGPNTTDGTGTAATIYTVGTEAGTIWFEGQDTTVVENSPASYVNDGDADEAKPTRFLVTEIKASNNVTMQVKIDTGGGEDKANYEAHDNILYAAQWEPDDTWTCTKQGQPVCDARNHNFLSNIEITPLPKDRSIAGLTWRYTWMIKDGSAVLGEGTKDGSGDTGSFNVQTAGAVGEYALRHQINVYQNGVWKSGLDQTSTLYQTYARPPLAPETPPRETALAKACGQYIAGGADSVSGCAAAVCTGIDGDVAYNPGNDDHPDDPLTLYDSSPRTADCWSNSELMELLLAAIGISADVTYVWGGCVDSTICLYNPQGWPWGPSFRVLLAAHDYAPADPHFLYHAEAAVGGAYYDPSYGSTGLITLDETAPAGPDWYTRPVVYPAYLGGTHATAATRQTGAGLPSTPHYVDWTCPH